MKKVLLFVLMAMLSCSLSVNAQFSFDDIKFWIGSGSDSAIMLIDFHDGSADSCYAWGYLFEDDGTVNAEMMLLAIVNADANLEIDTTGGFLNDVMYYNHSGIGGDPNWWSTWSGPTYDEMGMNMGLAATIINSGDWFGCSYTDFDPALPTGIPVAAENTASIRESDWKFAVYPNPVRDFLTIETDAGSDQEFKIFNLAGAMVYEGRINQMQMRINFSQLQTGLYILQIADKTQKLIIE